MNTCVYRAEATENQGTTVHTVLYTTFTDIVGLSDCALVCRDSGRLTIGPYANIPGVSFPVFTIHLRYTTIALIGMRKWRAKNYSCRIEFIMLNCSLYCNDNRKGPSGSVAFSFDFTTLYKSYLCCIVLVVNRCQWRAQDFILRV